MAENWCPVHKTQWFKKGKMKGFAHPILDEQTGEPTGQWCNSPESKAAEAEGKPTTRIPYGQDSPEKRRSIERQFAAGIAFEHGIDEDNSPDSHWTLRKALTQSEQIYQWISQGTIPSLSPSSTSEKQATTSPKVEPATDSQAKEESKPPVDLGIDMDWLRESLNRLSWVTVTKWLKNKYPKSTGVKVSEIVQSLTLEQRKEFAREVEGRLTEIQ